MRVILFVHVPKIAGSITLRANVRHRLEGSSHLASSEASVIVRIESADVGQRRFLLKGLRGRKYYK